MTQHWEHGPPDPPYHPEVECRLCSDTFEQHEDENICPDCKANLCDCEAATKEDGVGLCLACLNEAADQTISEINIYSTAPDVLHGELTQIVTGYRKIIASRDAWIERINRLRKEETK